MSSRLLINYWATLHFVTMTTTIDNLFLVLLNVTNNASALSWRTGACKKSKVGLVLACFFCLLMINSPLGINSKWISTNDKKILDDISLIKKKSEKKDSPPFGRSCWPRGGHAMSLRDKKIETEAAWQAHYIQWGLIMGISTPCGHQRGYQRIVAIYIKYLMTGVNFRNKNFLQSATVWG